uniref:GH07845p n=1 Tax=Drosophila melanogaster TaxID=7227 RepID=Q5BHY6_DROME|nr:GH07845p [Drosophila melanogaster]
MHIKTALQIVFTYLGSPTPEELQEIRRDVQISVGACSFPCQANQLSRPKVERQDDYNSDSRLAPN